MFGCGCCGRSSSEKDEIKRSLDEHLDKRFGDTFEGKNPQKEENEAKKNNDAMIKVMKKEGFEIGDMKVIKPTPVFVKI